MVVNVFLYEKCRGVTNDHPLLILKPQGVFKIQFALSALGSDPCTNSNNVRLRNLQVFFCFFFQANNQYFMCMYIDLSSWVVDRLLKVSVHLGNY